MYIEELDQEVELNMEDPQDIFNNDTSETDTVELESETDTQEDSDSKESAQVMDTSEENIPADQENGAYIHAMSTDDRIDESESDTDTENSLEVTQPLRQRRRASLRRNTVVCSKNKNFSTSGMTMRSSIIE